MMLLLSVRIIDRPLCLCKWMILMDYLLMLPDAPVTPTVTVSPTTFMDGTDVTLTCATSSTGAVDYQW